MNLNLGSYCEVSAEVRAALNSKEPIVALESTIIAHGMPYPQNLEVAKKVEQIIQSSGAIPATIAILDGKIKIGVNPIELEFIAKEGMNIPKASRRDLPFLLSKKRNGATTVAATMIAAQMAGIKIFATGGIGGVHQDSADSMDISADLQELSNTNVAVVCGGAKAILDLPKTLEYLETHGVPVIGYCTNEFPAFYARNSGLKVDFRLDTPKEIAEFLKTKWDLKLEGGVIIANPIPAAYSMDLKEMNRSVEIALSEAKEQHIRGKNLTPFLLNRIENITNGTSLKANIELVYNNARLAAEVAKEIVKM